MTEDSESGSTHGFWVGKDDDIIERVEAIREKGESKADFYREGIRLLADVRDDGLSADEAREAIRLAQSIEGVVEELGFELSGRDLGAYVRQALITQARIEGQAMPSGRPAGDSTGSESVE